ncbi:MAG: TolC family protein [Gemmatimonadota bacterium]
MSRHVITALVLAAAPLLPASAQVRADSTSGPRPVRLTAPLTLVQAVELGRRQAVAATVARVNTRVAQARVGQRRADLLPFVAGSASYTRNTVNLDEFGLEIPGAPKVTDPFDIWRLQLRASQTLVDLPAFTRLAAARDSVIAAGLDAEAAGNLAGATAGLAYLRLLSAHFTVQAREADSAVAFELLEQAKQLTDAGVAPAIDRTQNEVNFATARGQLVVARNERDRARLDLLRALFLPLDTEVPLPDDVAPAEQEAIPTDPAEAVAFALAHRPELEAERQRTDLARRQARAIQHENLPTMGVSGGVNESGRSELRSSWYIQVGVQVPILDGLRRQKRAQEQAVRIELQQLREQDLAQQIEQDVRKALLDLASAREQVAVARERLRLARQQLEQAQERFNAGVAGSVETTQAQAALTSARDALIQSMINFGTARVSAYRALGALDQLR